MLCKNFNHLPTVEKTRLQARLYLVEEKMMFVGFRKSSHLSLGRGDIQKALQELVFIAAILQLEENHLVVRQACRLDPRDHRILHPRVDGQVLNLWEVLQAALLLQVGRAEEANLQVDRLGASCPLQVQGEAVFITEVRQGK